MLQYGSAWAAAVRQPWNCGGSGAAGRRGAAPALGLPGWSWLMETNSAINSACLGPDRCAVTFTGPPGMAASFNRTSWFLKGSVLGTEERALANAHGRRLLPPSSLAALTGFGPNINIARDPRFGRNTELPGEDPYLTGAYAVEMVRGMQEPDANGYPKMLAYLKHFTAYSQETGRDHGDARIRCLGRARVRLHVCPGAKVFAAARHQQNRAHEKELPLPRDKGMFLEIPTGAHTP